MGEGQGGGEGAPFAPHLNPPPRGGRKVKIPAEGTRISLKEVFIYG